MIFPVKGRKCWILMSYWEKHKPIEGRIIGDGHSCIGWQLCGSRRCREVEIQIDGTRSIEYVCKPADIFRTKRAAEREAKRRRRQWERCRP